MAARTRRRTGTVVLRPGDVVVASSPVHGRGVFAGRTFDEGDVIEVCPVLVLPPGDRDALDASGLWGYYFEWETGASALALGYGSLYNHSWTPNACYEQDFAAGTVSFTAVAAITEGEEITINYTGTPDGRGDLWFDAGPPPG